MSTTSTRSLISLCATSEVPEGGALKIERDDLTLAVFNLAGKFYVTDDACTHGPGSLSEGEIDGEIVECNFHNGAFHVPTGRVTAPPCMLPLRTYRVEIVDGQVCIDRQTAS
ncbi:MAG: non-heme iron oxygenase ferredoxin subunit [Betaproteobacteria bacterium]|nr:non-heme iron oxygenase ferredoxin subunit [Betaproteobacteria bacterium]